MKKDSIGNRMKTNYENRYRFKLTRRTPVIMRLDGKCFHSLTKRMEKPFDYKFMSDMDWTAKSLLEQIQGAKCAYIQSDEISILITDFDRFNTDAWFDYNIQKMCSVGASMATVEFNSKTGLGGLFDARVFNIPKEEINNYFIWRQQDWVRNSIFMFASSFYSNKDLFKKNQVDIHEMLHKKGENWANLPDRAKNGGFFYGSNIYSDSMIFTKSRVIEGLLQPEEE